MASIKTNLPEVRRAIRALPRAFDLRRRAPGTSGSLGTALLLRAAWAIRLRSIQRQVDPQGKGWKALNTIYRRWKISKGFDPRKNLMTGQMLSLRELLGEQHISSTQADMTFGKTESAQLKAEWTTEGNPSRNRPARPFYDLGRDGEKAIEALLDAALDEVLGGL